MTFDRRLNAFRPDLADERLAGQVQAERYAAGKPAEIIVNKAAMRIQPDDASALDTELLRGEEVMVFDRRDGWAWAQGKLDGYVGYIREEHLGEVVEAKTHWVIAPRTFLYPVPDMKIPPLDTLSMGSRLKVTGEVETRGTRYLLTDRGALIASHLAEIGVSQFSDYVSIAGRLIETPYLWGGRSSFGIDCSGLVQVALMMVGKHVLRDADMQEASIGTVIDRTDLDRGDLIFWKGHVAILEDKNMLIHANGFSMSVTRERLAGAINRIGPIYGQPRMFRRP